MTGQDGFKGITKAQSDVIACWQDKRCEAGFVQRSDIDPGQFGPHLASISIIDMSGPKARFRIAGSGLRQIIGIEARGRTVCELKGEAGEALALGLEAAVENGQPVGGIIQTSRGRHAWLRLPLVGSNGEISQILCHDQLLRGREAEPAARYDETVIPAPVRRVAA